MVASSMRRLFNRLGYDNDVPEGKNFLPTFMLEHAKNNGVDGKLQFQKMIWILKEYNDEGLALFFQG
jgi:hypothetical protein